MRAFMPLIVALLVSGVLGPLHCAASQVDQLPSYFPTASNFGDGWVDGERRFEVDQGFSFLPFDVFDSAIVASYRGPEGANVALIEGDVADEIQDTAWDELIDDGLLGIELALISDEPKELGPIKAPEGCLEAERWEGRAEPFYQVGGVTACAISADRYLIAVTQGVVMGRAGYIASDAVITLVINKGAA